MSKRPTDDQIQTQAKRLLTLPGRPENAIEIAIALKRYGKTEYHVNTIVQHLLDTSDFFPTPKAIREASESCLAEPPPKYRTPNPDCSLCCGSGWHFVEACNGAEICPCRVIGAEMPPNRTPGNANAPSVSEAAAKMSLGGTRR